MIAIQHHKAALSLICRQCRYQPLCVINWQLLIVWRGPLHAITPKEITGTFQLKYTKMSKTVIDGVHRYPTQAIRVTIIGAGVAGLQAALECWRKGCEVVVLERATELSPVGM
jgi:NADPH-dependent 2,4-dienoyl-CoA reductase/sulfur reductase-like enzyme